jgi:hypothetical protein
MLDLRAYPWRGQGQLEANVGPLWGHAGPKYWVVKRNHQKSKMISKGFEIMFKMNFCDPTSLRNILNKIRFFISLTNSHSLPRVLAQVHQVLPPIRFSWCISTRYLTARHMIAISPGLRASFKEKSLASFLLSWSNIPGHAYRQCPTKTRPFPSTTWGFSAHYRLVNKYMPWPHALRCGARLSGSISLHYLAIQELNRSHLSWVRPSLKKDFSNPDVKIR